MSEGIANFGQAEELKFVLESYGVKVGIEASTPHLLDKARQTAAKALLERLQFVGPTESEHSFKVAQSSDGTFLLSQNGEQVTSDTIEQRFFKFFDSLLRITIAEHAVDRVFIHAGVVGWNGKAIVIPASSFRGKSTLVYELVKNGAEYYSDEYAILDSNGLVHSFPRDIALRHFEGGAREEFISPRESGFRIGEDPLPAGMLVLTEYTAGEVWKPERLTLGQGLIKVIPHTIPRHFNPEFSLKVLNTTFSDAIILESLRGDATATAVEMLYFLTNN